MQTTSVNSSASTSASYTWRSPDLGTSREVQLPQGLIRYHERGTGPTIVFAHGWLANANLWRKVVARLADHFRCITPDLPFGSHLVPVDKKADLTPAGCGQLIGDFLRALELSDVTLVGNDSGGAYSQIATAGDPARVSRLLLNSCETPYDSFPPPAFSALKLAAKTELTLGLALQPLRSREFRSTPPAYGFLIKHPIDEIVSDAYALPILHDKGVLHDASKVMRSASETYIQAAAEKLIEGFERPVLFVWSTEDKFFSLDNARRYAAALRKGSVELVQDAYSFTPEDQPEHLAELITTFMGT